MRQRCLSETGLDAAVVESPALGTFAFRDYLVALGEMPARQGQDPVEVSTIESAFMDFDPEELVNRAETMVAAVADAAALESALTEEVGSQRSMSFDPLTDLLKKISRLLSEQVERRGFGQLQPSRNWKKRLRSPAAMRS